MCHLPKRGKRVAGDFDTLPGAVIFTWDLDKTYLRTEFGSWRALMRTALEPAEHKRSYPGAATLAREIGQLSAARLHFISGSPRQMRRVIERKLRLDGIPSHRLVLKPNLSNVLRGRFRAVRQQLGYKLAALFEARQELGSRPKEWLFGDDAESDAFIYSLYAEALRGHVTKAMLTRIAARARLYKEDTARLLELLPTIPRTNGVQRIFIHLETRTPPGRFARYGGRLVPIFNYFQAALVLFDDAVVSADVVIRVAASMVSPGNYSVAMLANSFQDLLRRGLLNSDSAKTLGDALLAHQEVGRPREILAAFAERLRELAGTETPANRPDPKEIDFLGALEEERRPRRTKAYQAVKKSRNA